MLHSQSAQQILSRSESPSMDVSDTHPRFLSVPARGDDQARLRLRLGPAAAATPARSSANVLGAGAGAALALTANIVGPGLGGCQVLPPFDEIE